MFISAESIIYSRGRIPLSLALQSGRSSHTHTHTERITKHPQHWHTSRFVVAVFVLFLFPSDSCRLVAFDVAVAVEAIDNGAHVSDACVKGFSLSASTWAKCRAFAVSYRKDSRQCGRVGRHPDCFSFSFSPGFVGIFRIKSRGRRVGNDWLLVVGSAFFSLYMFRFPIRFWCRRS